MRAYPFATEELQCGHNAIVDWASVETLSRPEIQEQLDIQIKRSGQAERFRELGNRHLFDLLARFVLYDALILDGRWSGGRMVNCSTVGPNVIVAKFPEGVYTSAADAVTKAIITLEKSGALSHSTLTETDLFQGDVKPYADGLARDLGLCLGPIVNSNYSLPHTLFYLELSRALEIGVFLSPEKKGLLDRYRRRVREDAITFVETQIKSRVKTLLKEDIEASTAAEDIELPPVLDLVLRYAEEKTTSIRKALIHVRDTPEAVDFRDKLAAVQRKLKSDDRGKLEALHEIKELREAAETWKVQGKITTGALHLKIGNLPHVGWIPKLVGLESVELPIGRCSSYVSFVVNWYAKH
jgi:hypothetical protein